MIQGSAVDIVGRSLSEGGVRQTFGITVVGVERRGEEFTYATQDTVVRTGDVLIVSGRIDDVEAFAIAPDPPPWS